MSKASKRKGMEINVETGEVTIIDLPDLIEETPIIEEVIPNDPEAL